MAFGLYNYRKTGSGVQKGGPKKKAFFLFWEIFGEKFWKFFQINLIRNVTHYIIPPYISVV